MWRIPCCPRWLRLCAFNKTLGSGRQPGSARAVDAECRRDDHHRKRSRPLQGRSGVARVGDRTNPPLLTVGARRVKITSTRPLYNVASAGELVRFIFGSSNTVVRNVEFGVPVSVMNLNSPSSTTMLDVALAAINNLRPDPTRGEIEQLISAGNSFYRGMTLELRKRFDSRFSFRAGYTLSSLIDDGVVNTSDALVPGDFRAERGRSLLDRRHRFVFSGTFDLRVLRLSPVWRVASGAPFNISLGGVDRNLDDVSNDRPNYSGDLRLLRWRAPGEALDPRVLEAFSVPQIGQSGNLPRNAGRGPGQFVFDLNVTREFSLTGGVRIRPSVEFDNVLNKTVFSFGSEFISAESFLMATRTMRPRQIRVGLKIDFGRG